MSDLQKTLSGNSIIHPHIHSRVTAIDELDVDHRLELEREDNGSPPPPDPEARSRTVISFAHNDPGNPYNWSTRKKIFVLLTGISTVINSTLGSALPSNATTYIAKYFHVTNQEQLVLPVSIYLVGYVLGPLLFGPLSEQYGRKNVMLVTFFLYTVFTMACALAPNWPALLIFRFICGVNASSPISVIGGLFADIYNDPITRGRAMALFMAATTFGPLLGPIISGFISVVTWRWTFWVGLCVAGAAWIPLIFLPETFAPIILVKRARKLREETGNPNIFAPMELENNSLKQMLTVTLTRPVRMIFFEAIVGFTCIYISLAYAIFYLFFEAYPIIFQGIYGMNTGVSGLAFLPIGVGAVIACFLFLFYDSFLQRAKKRNAPWSKREEYRRLPLACIGGPLYVVSLFWLGWSAGRTHWIVPMLAGVPFGIGFLFIFMALLNYLTDAYEIFAASAMAASSTCRSVFGALLPLAARPMYTRLGVDWASSLLGFLSLGMTIIPFTFIIYGDRIRANSKFCQYLAERKKGMLQAEADEDPDSQDVGEKEKAAAAEEV